MKGMKFFLFLTILLTAASVHAEAVKILFFYPGGQGSQSVAQPILDEFSAALKKASGDQIEANISYIADKAEGLKFIQTQKPAASIMSLDAFYQYGAQTGAQVIAKTLQLPSADGSDQFFIVGKKDAALPTSGALSLVSTQPLEKSFLTTKLFPKLSALTISLQPSQNVVGELRSIGEGKKDGWVLLDQFEFGNISKLKTPWATALAAAATSDKISSAPFVAFQGNVSDPLKTSLQSALVKLSQDASAKEILQTLRIKGFKSAQSVDGGS